MNSNRDALSFGLMKQLASLSIALFAALAALTSASAVANESSHRAAAERLLQLMEIDQLMTQAREQLLQLQIRQHPELSNFESELREFFDRHLSWASVKSDIISIYMAEFPEADLKEMISFYETPVGRRAVQKMPALVAKTTEVSRTRLRQHLPELQEALRRSAAAKDAPP